MRSIWLAATLVLLCSSTAQTQVMLHGQVIEHPSREPLPAATVFLQNARGDNLALFVTNEAGEFHFAVTQDRPIRLKVESLGYRTVVTPAFDMTGYTTYRVEVRLDVSSVVLAPLEVIARDRGPTLSGFDRRRASGVGWYITRHEIERRRVNLVTDVLAMAPGVSFTRVGQFRIAYMRANCPAQVYIDGFLINRPIMRGARRRPIIEAAIDDLVRPSAVEGIELYQGVSKVPPEFLTPEAVCGVIAIWTRRGPV